MITKSSLFVCNFNIENIIQEYTDTLTLESFIDIFSRYYIIYHIHPELSWSFSLVKIVTPKFRIAILTISVSDENPFTKIQKASHAVPWALRWNSFRIFIIEAFATGSLSFSFPTQYFTTLSQCFPDFKSSKWRLSITCWRIEAILATSNS